ncbi:MarR family transcriptional regulator (plasmid) [Azospirillum humicireducens]|uniref:MarR family transcriptional regulator n=1 Tax=Azospirillum humicireducens TaxID=1226968 RepID=A0A2R4VWD8_9PROT|nr:MarR family transcriptional regulator [Azospirillum humicireducens]AWB08733.1 MarR family transcriptional regulator [Azospirillum humicireducens]
MSRYLCEPSYERDGVDDRRDQWARELPDVDTRGMAVLGRARRLTLLVRPQIDAVLASHGLDAGEADVLFTLLRAGPPYRLRPTELFKSMMVSSGGMTHRLNKLSQAGLIERRPAEEDGRSLLVELSETGRRTAEAAFREDMALEARLLAGLSDAEQEQLAALLRRLEGSLTADRQ